MALLVIKQAILTFILNPDGHQNCCIGSKVTPILLNGWVLPTGAATSGRVCAAGFLRFSFDVSCGCRLLPGISSNFPHQTLTALLEIDSSLCCNCCSKWGSSFRVEPGVVQILSEVWTLDSGGSLSLGARIGAPWLKATSNRTWTKD